MRTPTRVLAMDPRPDSVSDPQAPTRAIEPDAALAEGPSNERIIAGRYRLIRQVGSGGMGRVFEAEDLELGRRVAVKLMSALDSENEEAQSFFRRESRTLAGLRHPKIVAVHEAGQHEGMLFIVMDLIQGVSMAHLLGKVHHLRTEVEGLDAQSQDLVPGDASLIAQCLPDHLEAGHRDHTDGRTWYKAVASIMAEVAGTLAAAHANHVIHRDLKPGNVMLVGGGNPVVLDFGLARHTQAATGTVTRGLYGTVAYLAPEQVRTERIGSDPRTDVYQLGLMLYELCTLHRAFKGEAMAMILTKISRGMFERPRTLNPHCPSDLEAICLRALELRPEDRYASAQALCDDLERFVEGIEAPMATREGTTKRLVRSTVTWFRRRPAVAGGVAVLVAVLIGLGVFALTRPAGIDHLEFGAPFRYTESAAVLELEDPSSEVVPGDGLGCSLATPELVFVYALAWSESPEGVRTLAPVKPVERGAYERKGPQNRGEDKFALQVPPGRHELLLSTLDPGTVPGSREGVILWTSRFAEPRFEGAFEELISVEESHGEAIAYGPALELVHGHLSGERTRGGSFEDTADGEHRAQLEALTIEQVRGEDPTWAVEGMTRFEFDARVIAPGTP